MSVINSVREYIKTCPLLKTFNDLVMLYVDFSNNENSTTYSIDEGVTQPVLKTYIGGDTVEQFLFTFSSVEPYGSDFDVNMENIGFYEQFATWLKTNTRQGILPIMDEGKQATKIEALSSGYLFSNAEDATTARYVIQCKLTYEQKNNI